MELAREIAGRVQTLHRDNILAIGVYGSTASGTDGPYSDIEMICVLRSTGQEYSFEWSHGPWKAEVDFYSQDALLRQAAKVDGDWPLTHSSYYNVLALYDPDDFFPKLREHVSSQPHESFIKAIRGVIVGELYEWVGKLRNARHSGHRAYLPELALNMVRYGAFLIGLANRYFYSTGARVVEESLLLHGRPPGYDDLCQMAMRGDLGDPDRIAQVCEAFWAGVEKWAAERGIRIDEPRKIPF
jgi:kanamycin nucleotidyltransferase